MRQHIKHEYDWAISAVYVDIQLRVISADYGIIV